MITKYKAWHKTERRMLPVICIDFTGTEIIKGTPCIVAYEHDGCYKLEDVELVQFIGTNDQIGDPIYNGDILLNKFTNRLYIVKFIECGFWFMSTFKDGSREFPRGENYKVVGNVYENPELLEGKQ